MDTLPAGSATYPAELTESTDCPLSAGALGWIGGAFDAIFSDDQGEPLSGDPPCQAEFVSRIVDAQVPMGTINMTLLAFDGDAYPLSYAASCP